MNQTINTTITNAPTFFNCISNSKGIENLILGLAIFSLCELVIILILFWVLKNNWRKANSPAVSQ